jgi:hypothetical protein
VDTTTQAGTPAVRLGTGTTLEGTLVRGSAGEGVQVTGSGVRLLGGRIEGSAGIGLHIIGGSLAQASPVRVLGGATYGARLGIQDLALLAPAAAAQDSLMGNARDTLVLTGGTLRHATQIVRADFPWRVEGTVFVDSGAVLQPQPASRTTSNSWIHFQNGGRLEALGTAAQPITFTAVEPVSGWGGLYFYGTAPDTSRIRHAVIEHALYGVQSANQQPVLVDSTRIRRSRYYAAYLTAPGSALRHSVVDTTTQAGYAAVTLGNGTALEGTLVRGSADQGVHVFGNNVRLLGGRIVGSAGIGLHIAGGSLAQASPVRVLGGATYGARLGIQHLALLAPTAAAQDSLMGNARDTLVIWGGTLRHATQVVRADFPWRAEGTVYVDSGAVLRPQPGSRYTSNGYIYVLPGGRLEALGTAAQPITFAPLDPGGSWNGIYLTGAGTDTSRLVHARVSDASYGTYAAGSHVVLIDSSSFNRSRSVGAYLTPGSRLNASLVAGTSNGSSPAVVLGVGTLMIGTVVAGSSGTGVQVQGDQALLETCEVAGSGGHGVVIASGTGSVIRQCNLVGNGGSGVHNATQTTVDAAQNWWGDPEGPTGPDGDGVSGPVRYDPYLEEPVTIPYTPPLGAGGAVAAAAAGAPGAVAPLWIAHRAAALIAAVRPGG